MYRAAILVAVVAVAATRAVAQTPSYDDLEGIVEKALQKLHTELVGEIRTNFRSIESALSESRGMEEAANRATSGRVEDVERFLRSLEERIALIERKLATEIRGLSSRIEGIGTLQTELGRIRQQLSTAEKKPVSLIPNSYERWQQSDTDAEPNSRNPQIRGKRLIATNEGVCFLVGVSGDFRGRGEQARVYVDRGYWYVGGTSKQAGVYAEALCAR